MTIDHRLSRKLLTPGLSPRSTGTRRQLSERFLAHRRRGLSLIEVMFSIGIVAVGLLGTLTILPVAGHRVTQGTVADAADRAARNATREFDIRNLRRIANWVDNGGAYSTVNNGGQYGAYCLDPFGVLAGQNIFPYIAAAGTEPRMRRVTLYSQLKDPPNTPNVISHAQAMRIFFLRDDLIFDIPPDGSLPTQVFDVDNTFTPERRQADRKFSWMATIAPKTGSSSDLYVLAIVVFLRREVTSGTYTASLSPFPDRERLVNVSFTGTGLSGGDVLLTTRSGRPVEDLEVSESDWIMLSGTHPVLNVPIFRWYRVVSVEGEPRVNASGLYEREVSLFGQDWDINSAAGFVTEGTLLNGVVAVHEKTIRLDQSSAWDF